MLAAIFVLSLTAAPGRSTQRVGAVAARTAVHLVSTSGETGAGLGAYEWNNAAWTPNPAAYQPTLARLRGLGVSTLFVDITEAVSLTLRHSEQLSSFLSEFRGLVTEADADGLKVDAVGGDPSWSKHPSGAQDLLAAVARVTAELPVGALDGVQFDVEPWGLAGWRQHATVRAVDWLRFVQTMVNDWQQDGLVGSLGFTVPYWFDGDNGGVPRVTFDGIEGYPFQLSLALLAPLADTVLNVMAYRDTTSGPNGSNALFNANLQLAVAAGSHTSLLLGQETGKAKPTSITFYGKGCAAFQTAVNQIGTAFGEDQNYSGIPVDDVESLLALCPE